MKKTIFTIAIAGLLFFNLTSCNNNTGTESKNTDETGTTEIIEDNADPLAMESVSAEETTSSIENKAEGKVHKINTATFIDKIFDYKAHPKTWVYKGNKPSVIDFYATWCGPCKKVSPIMDELAKKYAGQVNFYKIDTDEEKELAGSVFGIRSIPSILYIPVEGQPMMSTGLYPKEEYIKQIETLLKK